MRWNLVVCGLLLVASAVVGTYALWSPWVWPTPGPEPKKEDHAHGGAEVASVKLSPQARANLNLQPTKVYPAKLPQWRSVQIPGWIIEHPGSCERMITAPLAGVVERLNFVRGDLVKPGEPLFTLKVTSEPLHTAQSGLYKTRQEMQVMQEEKKRLEDASRTGAVPQMRLVEVDNQLRLLEAGARTYERELAVRGLSDKEIALAGQGKFLTHLRLASPDFIHGPDHQLLSKLDSSGSHDDVYEVEEVKVLLGEQVQAGQPLLVLADHHLLAIEGRAAAAETALVQEAARKAWKLQAEFPRDDPTPWPPYQPELRITSLANRVDTDAQVLRFLVPLANQHQDYQRGGKSYRLWRYRPGQRVQLRVPVEAFEDVFVLPAAAVAREGPEAYVFVENGAFFERQSVRVVSSDRQSVLVANDGSLFPGTSIAMNGAVQLNWALKAQAGEGGGGHHHDHDH